MNNTILIVEDEGLVAFDLKERLEQIGYMITAIADSAAAALLSVERFRPSVVLMDIRLKGPQDGIETAEQIRRRFDVPVIFVTSHADSETLSRARVTEPFGYIVKPFHGGELRPQIEMALWKHQMEQKLRASEAWLSTTFRNVADALIATDNEGNIAFMNAPAARLTGWDWRESKGKPFPEVFRAFDEMTGEPVANPVDALHGGRGLGSELRTFTLTRRDDSGSVIVEAALSANREGGTLLGIIVVFRDLTERRKAEEQNRQLQKMNSLALLSVGLGREFTEAHRTIDETVTQLMAEAKGPHTRQLLAHIYERSAYGQSIVQQLLTLGRTDPGHAVMVDLNGVLTEMEPEFRKALGARSTLALKLQPGLPPIRVDAQDLRQNLLRLVVDARHAMPGGGAVEICTTAITIGDGKPGVRVAIRDTGKSIRSHAKGRVFDPYYQSRPGKRNPALSLALVYQFVALNGGSIDVESAPGEGTVYLLSFPAVADSKIAAGTPVTNTYGVAASVPGP